MDFKRRYNEMTLIGATLSGISMYRFIEGAGQCSTKQLSVIVNSVLQVVREQFRKYCLAFEKSSAINTFWSINSFFEFLDASISSRLKFLIFQLSIHGLSTSEGFTLQSN